MPLNCAPFYSRKSSITVTYPCQCLALESGFSRSAPIQLVFPSLPAGARRSYVPLEAAVTIVSNEECGRLYRMTIPYGKLCAGTGDADTCTVGDGWWTLNTQPCLPRARLVTADEH